MKGRECLLRFEEGEGERNDFNGRDVVEGWGESYLVVGRRRTL